MDTLKQIMAQRNLPDDVIREINKCLLLTFHLSTLQMNTWNHLENLFKENGFFIFEVKHNHNKIKSLLRTSYRKFFEGMSDKVADIICDDCDELEKMVYEWIGLNNI